MDSYEPTEEDYADLNGMIHDPLWAKKKFSDQVSSPFSYTPTGEDFWTVELSEKLRGTNSIMYQDFATGGYHITGDGVRLHLPMSTILRTDSDNLVVMILNGIAVSQQHRETLGY